MTHVLDASMENDPEDHNEEIFSDSELYYKLSEDIDVENTSLPTS